jgi:hypothetical protein
VNQLADLNCETAPVRDVAALSQFEFERRADRRAHACVVEVTDSLDVAQNA